MKAPAFQLYAADFYMDTVGWSATEVGAYFRLLLHEWVNGPLPDNISQLARIAGVDNKTMGKFWANTVGTKFVKREVSDWENSRIENGKNKKVVWENSRLEQTRKEQEEKREKLIDSGRKGGLRTQEEKRDHSSEASSEASSKSEALQSSSSKDLNTLVVSDASDPEKDTSVEVKNNGCPHQKIIDLYHEILPTLPSVRVWTKKRHKMLGARWRSSPEYQDLGWWEQYFIFVRDSCPHLTGKNDRQWTADLEWLISEANFVKTMEGRYQK